MALPTLSKTWQISANNRQLAYSVATWHRLLLWNIKEAMIGFASNPWVVVGSSDSSNADNIPSESNDWWVDYNDLIWGGTGNRSWIVLENVDGVQILIDLNETTSYYRQFGCWMSADAGFTGGGAPNVRPTATDERDIILGAAEVWAGNESATPDADHVWHMWHSTDGTVTRLIICKKSIPHTIWRFEKFRDPRAGQAVPYGCGIFSQDKATNALSVAYQEDNDIMKSKHGSSNLNIYCTGIGRNGQNLVETTAAAVAEELDNELWFTDIGYICNTTGYRGPKGAAHDMYWGQYQVASTGDTYPNDPSNRQFVQMGHFVLPWLGDGTVPETA
jgi:hypothetical protein